MGVLGTSAETIFEVNLIIQLVLVIALIVGVLQKRPLIRHGRIMALAVLVNFGATLLVMVPSLVLNWHVVVNNPLNPGVMITLLHSFVGTVALVLGLLFSTRFIIATRSSKPLSCGTRRMMFLTFILWVFALSGGLVFFVYYYS